MINRSHLVNPRYADVKAKRDKNPAWLIPCPDCKAGIGEPCWEGSTNTHASRRRMGARWLRDHPAPEPPVSEPEGDPCPTCGAIVPRTPKGILRAHAMGGGSRVRYSIPCAGEASITG